MKITFERNFLAVFEDDKILCHEEHVVSVYSKEEAHSIVRSLIRENLTIGQYEGGMGLAYWSDFYYFVRVDNRYFLVSRGY